MWYGNKRLRKLYIYKFTTGRFGRSQVCKVMNIISVILCFHIFYSISVYKFCILNLKFVIHSFLFNLSVSGSAMYVKEMEPGGASHSYTRPFTLGVCLSVCVYSLKERFPLLMASKADKMGYY